LIPLCDFLQHYSNYGIHITVLIAFSSSVLIAFSSSVLIASSAFCSSGSIERQYCLVPIKFTREDKDLQTNMYVVFQKDSISGYNQQAKLR
jgi:hypothetical protein